MKNILTLLLGALLGAVGTSILGAFAAPAVSASPPDACGSHSFPPYVPLDYEYLHDYWIWCDRDGNICIEFQLNHVIGGIPAYTWWRMDHKFVQNVVGEWQALGGVIE